MLWNAARRGVRHGKVVTHSDRRMERMKASLEAVEGAESVRRVAARDSAANEFGNTRKRGR